MLSLKSSENDDGSGEGYIELFWQAEQGATVLTHENNRGKGARGSEPLSQSLGRPLPTASPMQVQQLWTEGPDAQLPAQAFSLLHVSPGTFNGQSTSPVLSLCSLTSSSTVLFEGLRTRFCLCPESLPLVTSVLLSNITSEWSPLPIPSYKNIPAYLPHCFSLSSCPVYYSLTPYYVLMHWLSVSIAKKWVPWTKTVYIHHRVPRV